MNNQLLFHKKLLEKVDKLLLNQAEIIRLMKELLEETEANYPSI